MKWNSFSPKKSHFKAQEFIKFPVKAFIGLLLAQVLSRNFPPPPVESTGCPCLVTDWLSAYLNASGQSNRRSSASLLSQCNLIRSCDKLKIRAVTVLTSAYPSAPEEYLCPRSLSLSLTLHLSKYHQPLHFRYWPAHAVSLCRGETERPEWFAQRGLACMRSSHTPARRSSSSVNPVDQSVERRSYTR